MQNIRNRKTEERNVYPDKLTGGTRTQAVPTALRDFYVPAVRFDHADELDEIALHCASLPVLDDRAAEDTPGCDERGLPV